MIYVDAKMIEALQMVRSDLVRAHELLLGTADADATWIGSSSANLGTAASSDKPEHRALLQVAHALGVIEGLLERCQT